MAKRFQPNPSTVLFAIIDKTCTDEFKVDKDGGAFAGTIALLNASLVNLSTEIGTIVIAPPFQRTHVTSNAVGLLMQYVLDPPGEGGLGLRRASWQTNIPNDASVRVAERMGFQKEGLLKWDRVYHGGWETGKVGNNRPMPRPGKDGERQEMGRDTIILSHCWDDWEEGGRDKVKSIMDRR
jgi:RimJ/RimL family protein N-acetyltransferase